MFFSSPTAYNIILYAAHTYVVYSLVDLLSTLAATTFFLATFYYFVSNEKLTRQKHICAPIFCSMEIKKKVEGSRCKLATV